MTKELTKTRSIINEVYTSTRPKGEHLEYLLSLEDGEELQKLFGFADNVRHEFMGDGILLRGIVEFSNHCRNRCAYCGLNKNNTAIPRYRLSDEEILESVGKIAVSGIKTVVLQSGEEDDLDPRYFADLMRKIRAKFDMAITLSMGERSREEYRLWREAGVDRYLLKIETSDKGLYRTLHPGMSFENRVRCLHDLRELGYQVGSGIIVGLRGQTAAHLAADLLFCKEYDFDMIGIGPLIPHGSTELAGQEPGEAMMTLKTLALTRIVTRNAHLPATTALGSLGGKDYRRDGLRYGANVLMSNYTPQPYRKLYEIYPGKRCVDEPVGACSFCVESMAASIGRYIDHSRGDTHKARISL